MAGLRGPPWSPCRGPSHQAVTVPPGSRRPRLRGTPGLRSLLPLGSKCTGPGPAFAHSAWLGPSLLDTRPPHPRRYCSALGLALGPRGLPVALRAPDMPRCPLPTPAPVTATSSPPRSTGWPRLAHTRRPCAPSCTPSGPGCPGHPPWLPWRTSRSASSLQTAASSAPLRRASRVDSRTREFPSATRAQTTPTPSRYTFRGPPWLLCARRTRSCPGRLLDP
jgi:hypothetical protein